MVKLCQWSRNESCGAQIQVIDCSESATCVSAAYLSTHKQALVLSSPLLPHPPPVLFLTDQPSKEATPSDIQSCYACLHINRLLATELWLPAMCLLGARSHHFLCYSFLPGWMKELKASFKCYFCLLYLALFSTKYKAYHLLSAGFENPSC